MGRINVIIEDGLEARMHKYIQRTWPEHTFGKITKVIEEALTLFLKEKEKSE